MHVQDGFFPISYPVEMSSIEFYLECLSDSNLNLLIVKGIAYNLLISHLHRGGIVWELAENN